MMMTSDDPRLEAVPGQPLSAAPDGPAGDRTVRDQLPCQRGKWRLNQLGRDEPLIPWLFSAVCASSS